MSANKQTEDITDSGKQQIIIVGAGIVGACIAFYLTQHPSFDHDKHHVTIIESKRVAGGASGKAGGLLALWAFPQQIVPLSFQLHQELAEKYNGLEQWDYRRLTTVSVEGEITQRSQDNDSEEEVDSNKDVSSKSSKQSLTSSASSEFSNDSDSEKDEDYNEDADESVIEFVPKGSRSSGKRKLATSQQASRLPTDLNWIRQNFVKDWSLLGGKDTTAQVHPYKFTNFILKQAIETGSVDLIIGKVSEILFDETTGHAAGVLYTPSTAQDEAKKNAASVTLTGNQVVLAVGPWTSKILPDCPISGLRAHSITILPQDGQMVSPYAIFTELKILDNSFVSPEIYARKDEVYVCGEGDTLVDVPETTDDVQVVKEKCDKLFRYVGKLSHSLKNGRILKRQACYLPVLDVPTSSGPLIGETNVSGLFLASGHSCWGINNAPGTGKIMAELLLDSEVASADISALDPSLYFDASIW